MRRLESRRARVILTLAATCIVLIAAPLRVSPVYADESIRLATFSTDITIPLGHRCMGILPTRAREVLDPLEAHGFVLLSTDAPIVVLALDWCEVRNASYDQWRAKIAEAVGTDPERVLVTALHQHDAPVIDREAQDLLDQVGLDRALFDREFHDECIERVCQAAIKSLTDAVPITHIGLGKARVAKIASNRRVVDENGHVTYSRGSASGGVARFRNAPEGEIDPWLRTISLWQDETLRLELHAYATHPMSYYGRGGVSADFVGAARRLRQHDTPGVSQIYVSGCSGDVTAGKYNDGSDAMRPELAQRLYQAMKESAESTERVRIDSIRFRCTQLQLPFIRDEAFSKAKLEETLTSEEASTSSRILAAMGLSTLQRLERTPHIDLPCVDLGAAQIVLFPGESFVAYQLMAQRLSPDTMVMSVGYGECWTGYVPTQSAIDEGFETSWRWVDSGSEEQIRAALTALLGE